MADLAAADALYAWMLAKDPPVTHARLGDLELWLPETQPIARPASEELLTGPPDDTELRDLETLLHSSGADPTPFLKRGRAA